MKTTDELIASVDATLDGWNSALDSSLSNKKTPVETAATDVADKTTHVWEDSEKYMERLATFRPETYFAKPLAVSPIVCAAFGWESIGKDIIKCKHERCNATLCIRFDDALDKESHSNLCAKYLQLLATSHEDVCPFHSFAKRSLKVMERKNNAKDTAISECEKENSNEPKGLMDRVETALNSSTVDSYVPPYMLLLSNEMKRFEDFTGDGSVTKQSVEEGAIKIQRQIEERGSVNVEIPDAVSTYCREVLSDPSAELFDRNDKCSREAFLLSAFGWSFCEKDNSGGELGIMLKCTMCLSKSIIATAASEDIESPIKKKRRIETLNEASVNLLDSHRAYCPHVTGFANRVGGQSSRPGWKVVLSNLNK